MKSKNFKKETRVPNWNMWVTIQNKFRYVIARSADSEIIYKIVNFKKKIWDLQLGKIYLI